MLNRQEKFLKGISSLEVKMISFYINQLVIVDNELFIILEVLGNNKYLVQKFLDKNFIVVVDEFHISSY
jgi:hypothetical protein